MPNKEGTQEQPKKAKKSLKEFVADEDVIAELRRANSNLSRQLEKNKVNKQELVEAVYRASHDAALGLQITPVPKPTKAKKVHGAEIAIPVLGDWQLGKVTPTYSSEECEKRIDKYADKVMELTDIQRSNHPVTEAHVFVVGDLIEGVTIFPGQQWLVDSGLYRQITVDGPRIMCNFLRKMLSYFEKVHVVAVIGNHGRLGRRGDVDPESNGDRMLYRIVQQLMAGESRLTWEIPDGMGERNWYAIDSIGEKNYLLFHGDQVRGGFGGVPFYGFFKAINGWAAGAIPDNFDYAVCGHWHQTAKLPYNQRQLWINGSPESYNTFAQEQLKAMSNPSQLLLFAHPKRGVTCSYDVWL